MNILISGASGFIGRILVDSLSQAHKITVLGRNLEKLKKAFPDTIDKLVFKNLENHDAKNYDLIINLSGSNIGNKRWTKSIKKEIIESRISTNQKLVEWLVDQNAKPRFFCASAIGIYGAQDISTECFDEGSFIPSVTKDFLQNICISWEQSLEKAINASISVTILRFGVVLKKEEGMLKKLELPFRLNLGSVLGSGKQTLSWIHYIDLVRAINFLIINPAIIWPVNIVAPVSVTQKEFAQELAKNLQRSVLFRTPSWLVKFLFGEMGEYLLLKGQKVIPNRLIEMGFNFTYPTIESSLAKEYNPIYHI
jgi:uncharacterized protein (TIGR01777 family)